MGDPPIHRVGIVTNVRSATVEMIKGRTMSGIAEGAIN